MEKTPARKAIALVSGGADSLLALRLMVVQGIEMLALNFRTVFFGAKPLASGRDFGQRIQELGGSYRDVFLGDEYLRMLANPEHGFGKGANPCIDCHILMLRKAREIMKLEGAGFVVTGEVLGQRPMSQHLRALRAVEEGAGLRGRLLRPLSAKLLTPTWPELAGTVDRSKLLAITGRSRRPQKKLARRLGIGDIPDATGGCVLTEKRFGDKVRDMFGNAGEGFPTLNDARLLSFGRHLRSSPDFKIVVGRSKEDNDALENIAEENDLVFRSPDEKVYRGPVVLVRGGASKAHWPWIASVMLRYSDVKAGATQQVAVLDQGGRLLVTLEEQPMDTEVVKKWII
jgi:hypothetical protein